MGLILLRFMVLFVCLKYSKSVNQRQVLKGGQITLDCTFTHSRLDWMTWRGPLERFIYTTGKDINPDHKRIELTGDKNLGEYNLRIVNTSFSDQGNYTCQDGYKGLKYEYHLKVTDDVKADTGENACMILTLPGLVIGSNCRVYFGHFQVLYVVPRSGKDDYVFTYNSLHNRTTYTGNLSASVLSFCINDITVNDTGEFIFEIGNMNFSIFLEVYVPLTAVIISPTIITVEVFKTISIHCEAKSIPVPTISWFKNNMYLIDKTNKRDSGLGQTSSTLSYSAKKEDHKSFIYCHATNNFTSVASNKAMINILYPPLVDITINGSSFTVVEGQNIVLKCSTVDSNPSTLFYKWYVNGSLIHDQQLDMFYVQILSKEAYGCQGNNGIGSDGNIAESKFDVLSTPSPVLSDTTCNTSSTVTLQCSLAGFTDFYFPLQWIHSLNNVNIRSLPGEVKNDIFSLRIQFCNYQDTGQYLCLWKGSKSGLGLVNNTCNFIVNGPPTISKKVITAYQNSKVISVLFYSASYPRNPEWFYEGKRLAYGSKYQRSTSNTKILLPFYSKDVILNGFITNLTVREVDEFIGDIYSCKIENDVGFVEEEISTVTKDFLKDSDEMKVSTSVIAGVGVGCVVVIFIITVAGTLIVRKLRQRQSAVTLKNGEENKGHEMYEELGKPSPVNIYDRVE